MLLLDQICTSNSTNLEKAELISKKNPQNLGGEKVGAGLPEPRDHVKIPRACLHDNENGRKLGGLPLSYTRERRPERLNPHTFETGL